MEHPRQPWIKGVVVPGDGRGRILGFPTANLRLLHDVEKPDDGIYACWVKTESDPQLYKGVLHSGPRPTIAGAEPSIEVHLLEVDHIDLYGKTISFQLVKFLRAIATFKNEKELSTAIASDCAQALAYLKETQGFV